MEDGKLTMEIRNSTSMLSEGTEVDITIDEIVNLSIGTEMIITLFRSITLFCGTDNIPQNIPHIQTECEEYYVNHCQSHRTLLCI